MHTVLECDQDHRQQQRSNTRRAGASSSAILQTVERGSALFQPGDERRCYRVESGAISHFINWPDGRHEVIEFAFPGDIIGLGSLKKHVSAALAMTDTVVSLVDDLELGREARVNDALSIREADAVEREFDYLRANAIAATQSNAERRVAAYLVAIAHMGGGAGKNAAHGPPGVAGAASAGRHADFVSDENIGPVVAEMLGLDHRSLAISLAKLAKSGLVSAADGGLSIHDLPALEAYAERG